MKVISINLVTFSILLFLIFFIFIFFIIITCIIAGSVGSYAFLAGIRRPYFPHSSVKVTDPT